MIIIACTDENGGMMFNRRRQSRDIEVLNRISTMTNGAVLFMNEYSRQMFGGLPQIVTDNDFLRKAGEGRATAFTFCMKKGSREELRD